MTTKAVKGDKSECRPETERLRPVVNQTRCEGATDCEIVCPYNVFEIRKLTSDERKALPLLVQVKVFAHGGKQAFVVRAEECHACGLCVTACPEKAIKLVKYSAL